MKITLTLLAGVMVLSAGALFAEDEETAEQIKQAQEAAKSMGLKMPDVQKLNEESEKEDAAEKAAATPSPTGSASSTRSAAPQIKVDLPAGAAKGSLTFDGATTELKFASAFVDQKDDRKPVILLLSDQKLAVDTWKSEFDMMRDKTKWSGIAAFVDKDGSVYRTDVHTKGQQSSVSGMFDVKINDPTSSDLSGVAKSDSDAADKRLDVTFHAVHK